MFGASRVVLMQKGALATVDTIYVNFLDSFIRDMLPAAGGFTFTCNKKQGAVLILKDKAIHQSINDLGRVDAYIKKHRKSWYTFATDHHKLRLTMGDLVMVTGFDKTSRWALAAFTERSESASIHFGVGLPSGDASVFVKGEWGRQEGVQSRSGPPGPRKRTAKYDQCIFQLNSER